MKARKTLFIALIFSMLLSMTVMASANDLEPPESPIDPDPYQYTDYAYATCNISGGTATSGVVVSGKSTVTKITATYTLQKKSGNTWTPVSGANWSKTVNGKTLSASSSKSVSHGTYRTKAVIKVYSGANYETITKFSAAISY